MKNHTAVNFNREQTIAAGDARIIFGILVVSACCCLCCIHSTGGYFSCT